MSKLFTKRSNGFRDFSTQGFIAWTSLGMGVVLPIQNFTFTLLGKSGILYYMLGVLTCGPPYARPD